MPTVVELRPSNFRQAAASLRAIADRIEAGEYGGEPTIAIALMGQSLEVFAVGPHAEADYAAALLGAAQLRLLRAIERHGRTPDPD